MDITKLTRQSHRRDRPGLRLLDRFDIAGGRAHEFCGHTRRRLALWLAASDTQTDIASQILWIRPDWHPDRLHLAGVRAEVDPGRLIFVECCRPGDLLWCMEEGLRAGLNRLVVLDLPEPPGLTPVRRLHLAAEAGVVVSVLRLASGLARAQEWTAEFRLRAQGLRPLLRRARFPARN